MTVARVLEVEVGDRDNRPWLSLLLGIAVAGAVYLRFVGLGPSMHGPLHDAGVMDPFCGGTRATYVLLRGDVVGAWSWNPLVPVLAVVFCFLVVRLAVGIVARRWVDVSLPRRVWLPIVAVALVALQVNQQLQAHRLINVVPV